MITIGLIGGIASGKSEVARLLRELGAETLDADRVAHETYAPGTQGFAAVVDAFGPEVAGADGGIDRRRLGALVFAEAAAMRRLTDIVWPLTRELLAQRKQEAAARGTAVLVLEAAVLIEAGWQDLADEVWLVRAPVAAVRSRLRERRGLSAADTEARIAVRDLAPLAAAATVVIENDGDLEALARRVDVAWQALQARARE
jgi:dephospho-CoA kinase